jgi:hypothetical protein
LWQGVPLNAMRFAMKASKRTPSKAVAGYPAQKGSFDFGVASLREVTPPLRMTEHLSAIEFRGRKKSIEEKT